MTAIISPPEEAWDTLRPALMPGERRLALYLSANLGDDWEVYVQPKINDIQPDVVVYHPERGVMAFEVKDWVPGARDLRTDGKRLISTTEDGVTYVTDNAVDQAARYQQRLIELYSGLNLELGRNDRFRLVSTGVLLSNFSTDEAERLLKGFRPFEARQGANVKFFPILGGDSLEPERIYDVVPLAGPTGRSLHMPSEPARRIRALLQEPEVTARQRQPLPIDDHKRELLASFPAAGRRRVRGAAGSGKSTLLAAQAAKWALEGRDVLMLGFNITLFHHFQDLAVRYAINHDRGDQQAIAKSIKQQVTFTYLHGWIENVCSRAGLGGELRATLAGSERYPEDDLKRLVAEAVDGLDRLGTTDHRFDALCIDEGQDIDLDWWVLLQRCLSADGLALLAADKTQSTYAQTQLRWTDGSMKNAGFGGAWVTLKGSHRLPPEVLPMLRDFIDTFIPDSDANAPEAPNDPGLFDCELRWSNVGEHFFIDEMIRALREVLDSGLVAPSDTAILLEGHADGVEFMGRWAAQHNTLAVRHIFHRDRDVSRRMKTSFWPGAPDTKGSTIKSFKGWEARFVILGIRGKDASGLQRSELSNSREKLSSIYVGLSRVMRSDFGSMLWVVSCEPALDEFAKRHFNMVGGPSRAG